MSINRGGAPIAFFVLRALIALVFLWHGVPKAFDIAGAMQKFTDFGLPPVLGPITGWIEVVVAPLLLLGMAHRVATVTLAIIIVGAIITVQLPGGVSAGLERDLLILAGLLVLLAGGPGRWVLGRKELATPD